jgi:hypothetical protein
MSKRKLYKKNKKDTAMSKWYSVNIMLPNHKDIVNVLTKDRELEICTYTRDDTGFTFWVKDTKWPCIDVKFWSPISEPPLQLLETQNEK